MAISLRVRPAVAGDLDAILALLAADTIASQRKRLPDRTAESFAAILDDPNIVMLVADTGGAIIACAQVTMTPHLTYDGGIRATIEGVRVHAEHRGSGIGKELIRAVIELARERGCHMVQLTTDKRRPEALRFYEKLGFAATHEGMKLRLSPEP